jgi:CBS domain containing-hemolysin-like protein
MQPALDHFPSDVRILNPVPGSLPLSDVMKQMRELNTQMSDVIRSNRPTVLAISLEDCHACSMQEEALDNTQKQLVVRGVNFLIVKVRKPMTGFGG